LIRRLEAQEYWGDEVPASYVVGIVNGQKDQDFEACQQAGMDDCISKPVRKDELKMVMAQAVARFRTEAAARVPSRARS
jgi:CheY-like chemotaxis protein